MTQSSIEIHRSQPKISLNMHVQSKRVELGVDVCSKYRIYLDLKFWILFRDVELGRNNDSVVFQLLEKIKYLVSSNLSICPISESVFIELMKQNDQLTRTATAKLIDELSLGVTLIVHPQRIQQELCNSLYLQAGAKDITPLTVLVWTKLTSVFGEMHPSKTPFESSEELAIQKAFYDHMWDISLVEIIKRLDFQDTPEMNWQKTADQLNSGNEKHSKNLKSFKKVYRAEFEGGLSLFKTEMASLFNDIDKVGLQEFGIVNSDFSKNKKFELFSRSIHTLHIGACCHAAVRWDQKRKLTGNDLLDFHHAEAALPYCNIFLTEKPLKTLLSQNHIGLFEQYSCKVVSSAQEAFDIIREVNG